MSAALKASGTAGVRLAPPRRLMQGPQLVAALRISHTRGSLVDHQLVAAERVGIASAR